MSENDYTIKTLEASSRFRQAVKLHAQPLVLDFRLTPDEQDYLSRIYYPLPIVMGLDEPTDHPVAAAHQRYAERELLRRAKARSRVLHIGPSVQNICTLLGKDQHACMLLTPRDQTRLNVASQSKRVRGLANRDVVQDITMAATGFNTKTICINGVENCDFQAPFAVSNQSLYDITPQALAAAFSRHGLLELQAYMHFTPAAFYVDKYYDAERRIYHHIIKDKIIVGFGCNSHMYEHDLKNYMFYMSRSGYETPYGFILTLEILKLYGSLAHIRIARVAGAMTIHHMLPSAITELVAIPDMHKITRRGHLDPYYKCLREQEPPVLLVRRDKFERIYQFLRARIKSQQTIQVAYAYARSQVRAIRIGDVEAEVNWDITADDLDRIVLSVYLLAVIATAREEAIITAVTEKVEKLSKPTPWYRRKAWYTPCLPAIVHGFVAIVQKLSTKSGPLTSPLVTNDKVNQIVISLGMKFLEAEEQEQTYTCKHPVKLVWPVSEIDPSETMQTSPTYDKDRCLPAPSAPPLEEPQQECDIDPGTWDKMNDAYEESLTLNITTCEAPELKSVLLDALRSFKELRHGGKHLALDLPGTTVVAGVPGAGKSLHFVNNVIPGHRQVLMVVPFSRLAKDFQEKLAPPHKVLTVHKAMSLLNRGNFKPDLIAVDEAFTVPLPVLAYFQHYAELTLLGDPNQIGQIDFDHNWGGLPTLASVYNSAKVTRLNESYRCPQDIACLPFIRRFYPDLASKSKRVTSINRKFISIHDPKAQVIVATQFQKEQYKDQGACTIAEAQGGTFKAVELVLDGSHGERELLQRSYQHLVVALTRHTEDLIIRESCPKLLEDYCAASITYYSNPTALGIVQPDEVAEPIFKSPTITTVNMVHPDIPTARLDAAHITYDVITETLDKIYPNVNEVEEYQILEHMSLPHLGGAKGYVRTDAIHEDFIKETKAHRAYRFPVPQRVKVTTSSSMHTQLHAFMRRYTKKTKELPISKARKEAKALFKTLKEYVNFDTHPDELAECFGDAIERFHDRGHNSKDLVEWDNFGDCGTDIVKFMTKHQQKLVTHNPLRTDKAGQGIAAWHKQVNFYFVGYTRLLEKILHRADKKLVFASGRDEKDILALLDKYATTPNASFQSSDFKEFDSSQNAVGRELQQLLFQAIGVPPKMRKLFGSLVEKRRVACRTATADIRWKKDSGRVDTLIDNTLFALSIILSLIKNRKQLIAILGKGDDVGVITDGPVVVDTKRINDLRREYGFDIKFETGHSVEYISYIMNNHGVSLNFARLAAKITSRYYKSDDDIKKYAVAVQDLLKLSMDAEHFTNMVRVMHAHYAHLGVTMAECENLRDFCVTFSRRPPKLSNLIRFEFMTKRTNEETQTSHPINATMGNQGSYNPIQEADDVIESLMDMIDPGN